MAAKENFTEQLKKWRKANEENYARTLMAPPQHTTLMKAIPDVGVCLVMGQRGMGKTGLAHEIADQMHERKGKPAVLHLPKVPKGSPFYKELGKLLPDWFTICSKVDQWTTGATVIVDEASQSAHARRSQSGDAVELDDLIGISRQRGQLILFVSHHSRKLDINLIHELDRLLWKKPSEGHAIFEREEIADYTRKSFQFFNGIRRVPTQKRTVLALDFNKFSFYSFCNGLPDYWSERVSCIFNEIDTKKKGNGLIAQ